MIRSLVLAAILSLAGGVAAQTPPPAPPSAPAVDEMPGARAVSSASATTPAPAPQAKRETREITWLGAGAMVASGHTEFASSLGAALRLRADSGLAVMFDWTAEWYGEPVVDVFHVGLMWFGSESSLAPFAGANYSLFWVRPDIGSDRWMSGVGGRLGFFPWRQKKQEGHRFGLSMLVSYDHAFSCSRGCDVWTPQAALTWEPYLSRR